jgi:osmotically-inducible protein OsmY
MKVRIGTVAWAAAGIAAMAWLGTREAGRRPAPADEASAAEASAARRDRRLRARVRAALDGQSADPDAIEVVVNGGHVSLRGRVREDERDRLLERVLHTPGVVRVDNRLAVDEERPSSLATLPGATGAASAGAGSGSAR